jgi:hypothetical protein
VGSATIVVRKPTARGVPAKVAIVWLGGTVMWYGAELVGKPSRITKARDVVEGVMFEATSGVCALFCERSEVMQARFFCGSRDRSWTYGSNRVSLLCPRVVPRP